MILINLKKDSDIPIYMQIVNQIKKLIDDGTLKPGERLPPTREMSEKLQVNRSTICAAYEELWATGYIESQQGSYTFVRRRKIDPPKKQSYEESIINWDESINNSFNNIYNLYRDEEKILLKPGNCIDMEETLPDERLYPVDEFKTCFNSVVKKYSSKIFTYSEMKGYLPLREYICERMKKIGINTNVEEIIITNGAQNSLDLVTRLLLKENSGVMIESPAYYNIFPLLKLNNCDVLEIPLENNERFNFDYIKNINKENKKISFLYTTPNFQNPTGLTMSQEDRETVLNYCEQMSIPIIEDGFEEEMKYFGKSPLPIKALDRKKIVIFMGSFSKILFPGIRIGWVIADKNFIDRMAFLKKYSDLSTGLLMQAALYEFCHKGYFESHIKKLNRIYRKRMLTLLKCMKEYLPDELVKWTQPLGGFTLLMELKKNGMAIEEINEQFIKNGVAMIPGNMFYYKNTDKLNFRLSISKLNEQEIEEAVKRIRKTLEIIY